jgi:Signal transduction histidine kinase regulating C4-dicarboxylate transport system
VLFNLLKNALHAIRVGGDGAITISAVQDQDFCVLQFRDTGPGIAPDVLPYIFDAFFTTKRHGSGAGMGARVLPSRDGAAGREHRVQLDTRHPHDLHRAVAGAGHACRSRTAQDTGAFASLESGPMKGPQVESSGACH